MAGEGGALAAGLEQEGLRFLGALGRKVGGTQLVERLRLGTWVTVGTRELEYLVERLDGIGMETGGA